MHYVRTYSMFLILLLVLVGGTAVLYGQGWKDEAVFFVRAISAFGVFFAVIVALYGDVIKNHVNKIELRIEEPDQADSFLNLICTPAGQSRVFCHHLRVENMTPYRSVEGCRVWLIRILDEASDGRFNEEFKFAVPRLMEWAPAEFSKDARSFSEDQVFDFGKSYVDDGKFELNVFQGQGGLFKGDCELEKSRRYVFRITADNYIAARTFTVEVRVSRVEPREIWPYATRTDIKVVR